MLPIAGRRGTCPSLPPVLKKDKPHPAKRQTAREIINQSNCCTYHAYGAGCIWYRDGIPRLDSIAPLPTGAASAICTNQALDFYHLHAFFCLACSVTTAREYRGMSLTWERHHHHHHHHYHHHHHHHHHYRHQQHYEYRLAASSNINKAQFYEGSVTSVADARLLTISFPGELSTTYTTTYATTIKSQIWVRVQGRLTKTVGGGGWLGWWGRVAMD